MARILIADDEDDIRLLVKMILQGADHQITAVTNGREALAAASQDRPDLVVLDRDMPVMDGTEAAQRLRDRPETSRIPIIFLTALGGEVPLVEGFRAERTITSSSRSIRLSCWRASRRCWRAPLRRSLPPCANWSASSRPRAAAARRPSPSTSRSRCIS